jgi:hypothetical protein
MNAGQGVDKDRFLWFSVPDNRRTDHQRTVDHLRCLEVVIFL